MVRRADGGRWGWRSRVITGVHDLAVPTKMPASQVDKVATLDQSVGGAGSGLVCDVRVLVDFLVKHYLKHIIFEVIGFCFGFQSYMDNFRLQYRLVPLVDLLDAREQLIAQHVGRQFDATLKVNIHWNTIRMT